jgi:penicillin amidase
MARLRYGYEATENLFPDGAPWQDPIIPNDSTTRAGWGIDSAALARIPQPPANSRTDSALQHLGPYRNLLPQPTPGTGSNNWAIAGSRSATGFPILANDPHLDLTLPSIWLEMHLVAPGVNVYGATLPGTPAVIIGFNQAVAWGVTNVGADVFDWYTVKFQDDSRAQYFHGGQWKPTKIRQEVIEIRGAEPETLNVVYTHHGPVVNMNALDTTPNAFAPVMPGCALRWAAHDRGSNEFLTFHRLNRAQTYTDYTTALQTYFCPAQNFVFASAGGDVALWCNGRYPLKWHQQGKYVLDGTDPRHDWQGYIPQAQNPHTRNPERGFVSSANQQSIDSTFPYYRGSLGFAQWQRGARINQVLATFRQATPDSLRVLQNDSYSLEAEKALPLLLAHVADVQAAGLDSLRRWNYWMGHQQVAPGLFETWWQYTNTFIWQDDFPGPFLQAPRPDRTIALMLQDSASQWYDDRTTPNRRETLRDIVRRAWDSTLAAYTATLGPTPTLWKWGIARGTDVRHLLRLEPFGALGQPTDGCPLCVNSTKPTNGPSWRMVVALNADPKKIDARGLYPGGQSGNPGSPWYQNMVPDWTAGQLHRLLFVTARDSFPEDRTLGIWAAD